MAICRARPVPNKRLSHPEYVDPAFDMPLHVGESVRHASAASAAVSVQFPSAPPWHAAATDCIVCPSEVVHIALVQSRHSESPTGTPSLVGTQKYPSAVQSESRVHAGAHDPLVLPAGMSHACPGGHTFGPRSQATHVPASPQVWPSRQLACDLQPGTHCEFEQ